MPEFSSEAVPVPNPDGTEILFAVRASDGVMIRITAEQLLAALGLKTINGEALRGTGNITVGSSETTASILQKIGVMPEANLPSINLMTLFDQSQFALVGGKITYLGGGSTPTPTKLATPVLTFVSATENSLTWSWTRESNGQTSLFQIFINGNWSNVSTGSETSKQITGLGASTDYPVRVLSRAPGYIDSDYATGTHATTAPTGLPTPVAPTVVFDATARTLKFTHPTYPNGIEYRVNGGSWSVYVANTTIPVGDNAVAANYYEARVKSVSGTNNVGNVAGNTAIAATGGGGMPAGFSAITGLRENINLTINTNTYTWPGTAPYGAGVTQMKIAAGQAFEIRFSASQAVGSGWLGVNPGTNIEGLNSLIAGIKWNRNTNSNGRFNGISGGNGQDDFTNKDVTGTATGSIIGDGTHIKIRGNYNGDGITFLEIDDTVTIDQPNVDMYVKMFFDDENSTIMNAIGKGLVAG